MTTEHHIESERLADEAHIALRRGEADVSRQLFEKAAKAETAAFASVGSDRPRTTGIFAVSAAALWYKSGLLAEAEQFAHDASRLSHLPSFARRELRELLQAIWNEQAQKEAGVSFAAGQIVVSVQGGEVVSGGAPLDLILGKVQVVQSLFYRTAEYLSKVPHRVKGQATKFIQDRYRPWLFQSVPGSYQFTVAIQKPPQKELFSADEIEPEQLTEKFLEILRICNDDPSTLPEVVSNLQYRETFLKMARNLAPTGRAFSRLELRSAGRREPVIMTPVSRTLISETLRPAELPDQLQEDEQLLRGNLRALHLDSDWLEIAVDGKTTRVTGLSEAVDDLIGPMVNHDVVVRVRINKKRQALFVDIEQEE